MCPSGFLAVVGAGPDLSVIMGTPRVHVHLRVQRLVNTAMIRWS